MTNHQSRRIANMNRVIRRHIAAAGCSVGQINEGMAYAKSKGYDTAREGYILAVSRILYSDDQLADGEMFTVADGFGPR